MHINNSKKTNIMNQEIFKTGSIILTFSWMEDGKVFIKYFIEIDHKKTEEMTTQQYSFLNKIERDKIEEIVNKFFLKNPLLLKWSY